MRNMHVGLSKHNTYSADDVFRLWWTYLAQEIVVDTVGPTSRYRPGPTCFSE